MKNNVIYLWAILLSFFLYACPAANDSTTTNIPITSTESALNKARKPSENISLGVDTTYVTEGEDSVTVKLVWNSVSNVQSYSITITPGGAIYNVSAEATSVEVKAIMAIDDLFEASLTAVKIDRSRVGPILFKSTYVNGGGTVDDVPFAPDWPFICGESNCDFLKFNNQDIKDCNGNLLDPIPLKYRNGVYYKRTDVCSCLTNNGTTSICDGVQGGNLNTCLGSIKQYLKHDYDPCNE